MSVAPTHSEAAADLRGVRAGILGRPELTGPALRAALVAATDGWLTGLIGAEPDVALMAVGGYGRREPAPGSDLDLVLVHRGRADVGAVAERVWYPVWDSGVGLDHAVRTVPEALAVAAGDLKAALGLLDARHVAGSRPLTDELAAAARAAWRAGAGRRLPELAAAGRDRAERAGELAFLLEPDLRDSRGGLREVHAMRAIAAAWLADPPSPPVLGAYAVLLDARGELHRRTGRPGDRLLLQEQDGVAAALGYDDADALLAAVSAAGRTISYAAAETWRRVAGWAAPARRAGRWRGGPPTPLRRPLAAGVVEQAGEVVLARDADPAGDPVLLLRAAAAAAGADRPLAPYALDRLARFAPPLPRPWPGPARDALIALLGAGPAAVPVLEALDQAGLLVRLLPEWAPVRFRPQRNAYHRYTVDRHLMETAAQAAALTRSVSRPDLLLLAAFLHDIGKAAPGDHSEAGARVAADVAAAVGLPPQDCAVVALVVRHHLLLAETATRRDLDDPATLAQVAAAVDRSAEVLDLLHALTEADARATGPSAWSEWKARLVAELVSRVRATLAGVTRPPPGPTDRQRALAGGALPVVDVDGGTVTVAARDRPGLLAAVAGALALHRLEVRAATAQDLDGVAVSAYDVLPRFGASPDIPRLVADVHRALAGSLPIAERLAERDRAHRPPVGGSPPPTVRFVPEASAAASVLEVRDHDRPGLLHRLAQALTDAGVDIRSARVNTLGAEVVDAFYLTDRAGGALTPAACAQVAGAVRAALAADGPPAPR